MKLPDADWRKVLVTLRTAKLALGALDQQNATDAYEGPLSAASELRKVIAEHEAWDREIWDNT